MKRPSPTLTYVFFAALLWSGALVVSFVESTERSSKQLMDMAYAEARANLNKDITFRRWGTRHGGVYVPITEDQPSVPWLSHVPGRDVTTTDGRKLTLLNPASMLRQMMDAYSADYGIRGRITGLKYLNPSNAPDAWERRQLESFQRGDRTEVWEVADIDGAPYLRHLRAMFMEPGCEKCHAILGYQEGDMRGATGLNLPLTGYLSEIEAARRSLGINHGAIWLLGLCGIGWAGRRLHRHDLEREAAAETLRLYANMFEHSGEAIMVTDAQNRIVTVNPALSALTGYTIEELRGHNPHVLSSGHTPPEVYQSLWTALNSSGFWQGELWDRRKDGGVYPKWASISVIRDAKGKVVNYIAGFTDMTERKTAEQRIEHLAHHDTLTGLFNRFSLESRLEQALLAARRDLAQLAVIFIDLDRFKNINDTLGHHVGDMLLIQVAARIRASVRESDIVARLGGDEFVAVLTGMQSALDAAPVVGKMLHALGEAYRIDGNSLHATPSIGVSIYPNDGETPESLMKNADTAMYHAKESGRNNIQFFTANMNIEAGERLELENDLRHALERNEFLVHYQPQICTRTGQVRKVEALLRWRHPRLGLVSPLRFIPLAEETGLIEPLGAWVLDQACRQWALWREAGIEGIGVSVNLSAQQLRSVGLVAQVEASMRRHGLRAGDLELEVTESTAMDNPERAINLLEALRQLGVVLAIDDFGTGYSSLAYLKLLPIHILKLDRAFVRDIETDSNDAAISAATIALAHSLGLKVVAEGVETEGQRAFLSGHGCDYLQGYLLGKPEDAAVWTPIWRAGITTA